MTIENGPAGMTALSRKTAFEIVRVFGGEVRDPRVGKGVAKVGEGGCAHWLLGLGVGSDSCAAAGDVDMFKEGRPKERLMVDANATGEGARFIDELESARRGVVLLEVLAARFGGDTKAAF